MSGVYWFLEQKRKSTLSEYLPSTQAEKLTIPRYTYRREASL